MSKKIIAFILFLLMPLLVFSGFSSWIIVGEKDALIGENPTTGPVCYINSNDAGKQYTSIEKALSVAVKGDKVYVIPTGTGTVAPEVKIRKDCTVKSGVTLYLPTDNTNYDKGFGGSVADFADSTPDKVNTNRRNFVSIDTDVVMTIATGGTLVIGGTFGSESNGMTGGINGVYSEIMLYADAKIICNGSMECYGYIKEASNNNGSQLILDGAAAQVPFTIYDFKGGTQTTNLNGKKICPFDEYDIACIQSEIVIHSNSILKGMVRLEAGGQQLNEVITVVGGQNVSSPTTSNTALILRSGYAKLKYDSTFVNGVCVTTIADRQTTIASLHNGTIEIGGFKLTIMYIYEVDTTKMFFPVSYRFSYEIDEGGILNIPLKVKFMPGSKLLVKKGGTVNIKNDVIFYPNTWKGKTTNTDQLYPGIFDSAELINNGSIIIHSGAKFGATVKTTEDNARLGVLTEYVGESNLVSSTDDSNNVTTPFKGYINNNQTIDYFETKFYVSKNGYWVVSDAVFELNYVLVEKTTESQSSSSGVANISVSLWYDELYSIPATTNPFTYTWKLVSGSSTLSANGSTGTLTNKSNSPDECIVSVTVKDSMGNIREGTSAPISVPKKGSVCFAKGTLITMADGSQKKIENIKPGEMIMSINHETGKYEAAKAFIKVNHGYSLYSIIKLKFSDNSELKLIGNHGLFDITLNRYVPITEDNLYEYIGHEFLKYNENINVDNSVKLISAEIIEEYNESYTIASEQNMNHIINGLVGNITTVDGIYNFFEFDSNFKYDEIKMKEDIEKYGLYSYEEFSSYTTEYVFNAINMKYYKISVGKGYMTYEDVLDVLETYNALLENGELEEG